MIFILSLRGEGGVCGLVSIKELSYIFNSLLFFLFSVVFFFFNSTLLLHQNFFQYTWLKFLVNCSVMVIKGRGRYPKKKPVEIESPTPHILKLASLKRQDAADKALELLHEVAALVAPVMSHYGFKVGLLCEMYPKDKCLLGLNVNRGQKICLRLRSPTDNKWFLCRDEIVGTMLHELTHNWHGAHDNTFYKTLEELKDKYLEFQVNSSLRNSTYRNNFSAPRPLRFSANKPKAKYTTRVSKLGTNKTLTTPTQLDPSTLRAILFKAAQRRINDTKICADVESAKLSNVPEDDELKIIEVISLDTDITNSQRGIEQLSSSDDPHDSPEVIVLD